MTRFTLHVSRFTFYVLLTLLATSVAAQEPVTDDQVNEVARELYCPICENVPLDVCPTQACIDWRGIIRAQLAEGRSKEEIKAYFVEQYGDRVLAEPRREGFYLLIWLLPVIGVAIGAFILARNLRRMQTPAVNHNQTEAARPPVKGEPPKVSDTYLERIERELREAEK